MGVHSTQGSVVVHRIRNGKAGRDAGSYYLTVSPTEFSLDSDGKVKGDGKVKVQAWLSVAAGTPAKAADSDIYLVVKAFKTDGTEATLLAKQQAAYEFDVKNYSTYRTFVVTLYDGTAKTNQWDSVTVIVGAQDAKDSIRVDLENENDSMLYQGDGTTKVNGDNQFLTSQAHLYDGYTKDPSGVVWSIDSKTDGCDATISTAGLVRVNSITALVNVIKVKAVYKGGSYYAEMTVKKLVGVDKYELWLSVVSVGYNTNTKQATATSVTIRVYKTAQNGTRTNISTLPTGMTVSGSSTLSRAYSGGYATMPVDTSKSENYVVLKQGTQELDRETIPVLSFVNGQNVIRLDLDNENDSILYQGNGTTMVGSKPTSKWYLYDGITDVSSQVSLSDIVIESNSTGVTSSFTNTTDKRTIRIDGITSASGGSGEVILKVKYKDEYYRARMTVKRLVGVDKYELEVSPNSVGFNTSTGTNTGSAITIKVWKTAQNGTRTNIATLPSGYKLLIGTTDYTSSYKNGKYSFTASSTATNYVITLTDGTNVLDTETVPVLSVKDGGKGDPGDPGQPGANGVSYILDVQKADIQFGSDGKVKYSEIYGYAYKLEDGTLSAVDLTQSNNYVQIRYNVSATVKITYTATKAGRFDDNDATDSEGYRGDLARQTLSSSGVYVELIVGGNKVAQFPILVNRPGADGYNYLPINNGPYNTDPNRTYTWNIEKRDFVDVEENGEWNRYGVARFGLVVPKNTPPPNSTYWTKVQEKLQTLLVNTVFATNANIGGFMTTAQRMVSSAKTNGNYNLILDGSNGTITALKAEIHGTIYADDGVFKGKVYASDGEFNGKIVATSGKIGGFTIGSNRIGIDNSDGSMNINGMSLYDDFICFNDTNRQAIMGTWSNLGMPMLMRLSDTSSELLKSTGIVFDFRNAPNGVYNRAFGGNGDGVLNGSITGYKLNVFTPVSGNNTIPLKEGTNVLLKGRSYTTCYLPTLQQCQDFLGCGTSTKFAFDICIMGAYNSSHTVYGYVDSTHGAKCPHIRNNDEYQDCTGGFGMGAGDILLLKLVYDGTDFNAFIISHRN